MNYQQFLLDSNPKVKMTIQGYGTIELELFPEVAPITVKNFLSLVKSDFYNGLTFHRVISGFMIQGGDPLGNGTGGSKEKIKGEFSINGIDNPLMHTRGVISMARSMFPDSASSQFFIMHQDAPHLDGAYAAFGVVTKGIEVVDKIASVQKDRYDMPLTPVVIEKVELI
ncbi:MAG: peptidylprolyl isomerase [Anaeroplasmataceae bacterium]|nr:peptidylprolyl isomerase [Anaeroplasmataceae bacterium]